MPVVTERAIRADIDALLAGALIVFMAALAVPMANALLTVDRASSNGSLLTNPGLPMQAIFLLCIETIIVAFVAYIGYRIISRDRRRGNDSSLG